VTKGGEDTFLYVVGRSRVWVGAADHL